MSSAAVWLIARLCLVAMFPFSAADKVWHWTASLAQTEQARLPGGRLMLIGAIAIEGLTPVCIVTGFLDRPAAALLAFFCVVTAFLYHPFWTYPDLLTRGDASQGRDHFWQFVKNFGLVGGLLLVVFAGSLQTPGAVLAHPFQATTDQSPGAGSGGAGPTARPG